jgi:hypothetical protein
MAGGRRLFGWLFRSDFTIINSRKRLIELLPVTKMLAKLDYDKIKISLNLIILSLMEQLISLEQDYLKK